MTRLCSGDTFEHRGRTFRVDFAPDEDMGPPWKEHDGHGEVSDWRRSSWCGYADKAPGERPLYRDGGAVLFYDWAGTIAKAKREGWGMSERDPLPAERLPDGRRPTAGQIAERAVEEDFQRLKAWCEDRWSWIGILVREVDEDGEPVGELASLWGVESDAGEYLAEVARDLADELAGTPAAA